MTAYWLMKTEPDVFSIDDLKKKHTNPWDGVRNYQARNYMRNMKKGDLILFYHSSTEPPGVAGLARVHKEAYPDFTSWDKKSEYFDPRSSREAPLWYMVTVEFVGKVTRLVTLEELKSNPNLKGMRVTQNTRLSVQPVEEQHFHEVLRMAQE
jgi:predicted RNA-binding protein with PUA-like domain